MSFEDTRGDYAQQQFEILEIDLPVITGVCTYQDGQGFGTPLTCDQAWTGEYKTYVFTNVNAPTLPIDAYRIISSISEVSPTLSTKGLASKGSFSITLVDFTGDDPNIGAPGVTSDVIAASSFLQKIKSRQIIDNNTARLKRCRVSADGTIDIDNNSETVNFIATSLDRNKNGTFSLKGKDILFSTNKNNRVWPAPPTGSLRSDIDSTTQVIPVDGVTDYSSAEIVRIGKEFLVVNSVTGNLTGTATLNVDTRGLDVYTPVSNVFLSVTNNETHSADDEVFICRVSDNERIDILLASILTDSDVSPSLIPSSDWADEIDEYFPPAQRVINTLHSESEDLDEVLNRFLGGYLLNVWADPVSYEVKLSAISRWKDTVSVLTEGREITSNMLDWKVVNSIRATRAFIRYKKNNLALSNDNENFRGFASFEDPTLLGEQFYKEHKDKDYGNNFIIDKDAAKLLTQRYVSRYKLEPRQYSFPTVEQFLTYRLGDVVRLSSLNLPGPDGSPNENIRAQITSVQTKYTKDGRKYDITAETYEPDFDTLNEIVLSSPLSDVNLYILAGAPNEAVELTFVFTAYSFGAQPIRAGDFPVGSKLIIILADGFDGQADGGLGGNGASLYVNPGNTSDYSEGIPTNGTDGGIVYIADGVDTDIYFSGATPNANYPVADGYIRAPSGGSGGFNAKPLDLTSGDSGSGGDGRTPGNSGFIGVPSGAAEGGIKGVNGKDDGTGTGFGVDGVDNDATKGLKGSGVIDAGATVTFFGDTPTRYINGNGDH